MKKIVIFCILTAFCISCGNRNNHRKPARKDQTSYFILPGFNTPGPVSLVYKHGVYHLFYLDPEKPGPLSVNYLGHATSRDLIVWNVRPKTTIPGNPDSSYHGGIISDSLNSSGLGTPENPPLVALFSSSENNSGQPGETGKSTPLLAYSIDDGNSWNLSKEKTSFPEAFLKYPQNVNIFWHQPVHKWIMSIGMHNYVLFYSSTDLHNWDFESSFDSGFFSDKVTWARTSLASVSDSTTCALMTDILPMDSNQNYGGTIYITGYFDGHTFTKTSSRPQWLDYGKNVFGTTGIQGPSGKYLIIPWIKNSGTVSDGQDLGSTGVIARPREINNIVVNNESLLTMSPVRETNGNGNKEIRIERTVVGGKGKSPKSITDLKPPFEIYLSYKTSELSRSNAPKRFGVILGNRKGGNFYFGYDTYTGYYFLNRPGKDRFTESDKNNDVMQMPYSHTGPVLDLNIIVSKSAVEFYSEEGKRVMSCDYVSTEPLDVLTLFSENGEIELTEGKIINLGREDN